MDVGNQMYGETREPGSAQENQSLGSPSLDMILSIPVTVQVVLGSTSMPVSKLMKLGRGGLIPLDQKIGDPVNVVVNGRVVARGEVVVYGDDNTRFGVSLTEILSPANSDRAP